MTDAHQASARTSTRPKFLALATGRHNFTSARVCAYAAPVFLLSTTYATLSQSSLLLVSLSGLSTYVSR